MLKTKYVKTQTLYDQIKSKIYIQGIHMKSTK